MKIVVAFMVYVENGWYGDRYRFFYAGPDGLGFKNKTEARKSASLLKKAVKKDIKESFGDRASISPNIQVGDINDTEVMPVYKYQGAFPSWACTNVEIKLPE